MPHFQTRQATDYRDLLDDLRDFVSSDHVATAAPNAAGTGYVVGDILTIAGGTFHVQATVEVTQVGGGGEVQVVRIQQSGGYTVNPSTPNTPTGGTGTGCTLDLTFSGILWTVNRDDQTAAHDPAETELQLQGVGSGSDEVYVGIRTYFNAGTDARNWELAGFTGFDSGETWENQPGKSPGRFDDPIGGAFVPLQLATMNYWFNIDGRRIIVVAEVGGAYSSAYLGFMNQYATDTEYPYPMLIMGSTSDFEQRFTATEIWYSGISDPIKHQDDDPTTHRGPGLVRFTDGQWYTVANSEMNTGTTRSAFTAVAGVYPVLLPVNPDNENDDENRWYPTFAQDQMSEFVPLVGVPGTESKIWAPTPDTGGDIYPTWPCTVMMTNPSRQILGEMDDVRWFPAAIGPVSNEDTFINDAFTAFQCGNRTEPWARFLIRTRPD